MADQTITEGAGRGKPQAIGMLAGEKTTNDPNEAANLNGFTCFSEGTDGASIDASYKYAVENLELLSTILGEKDVVAQVEEVYYQDAVTSKLGLPHDVPLLRVGRRLTEAKEDFHFVHDAPDWGADFIEQWGGVFIPLTVQNINSIQSGDRFAFILAHDTKEDDSGRVKEITSERLEAKLGTVSDLIKAIPKKQIPETSQVDVAVGNTFVRGVVCSNPDDEGNVAIVSKSGLSAVNYNPETKQVTPHFTIGGHNWPQGTKVHIVNDSVFMEERRQDGSCFYKLDFTKSGYVAERAVRPEGIPGEAQELNWDYYIENLSAIGEKLAVYDIVNSGDQIYKGGFAATMFDTPEDVALMRVGRHNFEGHEDWTFYEGHPLNPSRYSVFIPMAKSNIDAMLAGEPFNFYVANEYKEDQEGHIVALDKRNVFLQSGEIDALKAKMPKTRVQLVTTTDVKIGDAIIENVKSSNADDSGYVEIRSTSGMSSILYNVETGHMYPESPAFSSGVWSRQARLKVHEDTVFVDERKESGSLYRLDFDQNGYTATVVKDFPKPSIFKKALGRFLGS